MLTFLNDMINQGRYQECLSAAEQMLLSGCGSLPELAELNLCVARSRMWLRDYFGAVPAAQLAFKIAKDQVIIPSLIRAIQVLGTVYYYTRQYDNVVNTVYQYYELVPVASQSPAHEGTICNLVGLSQYYKQAPLDAAKAFGRAAACFRQVKDNEAVLRNVIWVVRCSHAVGDYKEARVALRQAMRLSASLPKDNWVHQAIFVQRSENAFQMGRAERGAYLALRALAADVNSYKEPKFRALMLLHGYYQKRSEYKDALGYALAARVTALDARLFHLEYEAAEAMVQTMQAIRADDVSALDQEYLSTGVDMSRYLPDSVLRNRA